MQNVTRLVFFILLLSIYELKAQDTLQHVEQGRKNATGQLNKPYVILISADGFRYDYAEKYNATNLLQLGSTGVKAESMIPSYPSVTYPNHYTVATGLYPSHHGIVYNQFYDRRRQKSYSISDRKTVEDGSWYGGTPLWVLAEQQGMLSAAYCYVGTEAAVQNTYSTYWYKYTNATTVERGIEAVMNWLRLPDEQRPHLITFYIGEVDHAGHVYGPDSKETKEAVLFVDRMIRAMTDSVSKVNLPVNFVFLADHGMANVDTTTAINVAALIDTSRFIIKDGSTSMHLYAKFPSDIKSTYQLLKKKENGFTVYLREQIPSKWHYDITQDLYGRIGDIYIVPDYPKVFSFSNNHINPGTHGFDPELKQMHACFYAWGPQFQKGKQVASFENIHVYPMICKLLGLNYGAIDGKPEVLREILK
jgi:predicted AlkP superfamily pyrophosphatase or phosphodiesterase